MADVRISMIAAIGEKGELGKDNALLWHIPGELPRFKRITMGHPIIMGRKTFESIGRVLPGRLNIIISRNVSHNLSDQVANCLFVTSLDQAIQLAKEEEARLQNVILGKHEMQTPESVPQAQEKSDHGQARMTKENGEIFIIGGGQIFQEALSITDRLYLTIVHKAYPDADTFFPVYSDFTKVIEKEEHPENDPPYTFLTLER